MIGWCEVQLLSNKSYVLFHFPHGNLPMIIFGLLNEYVHIQNELLLHKL